MKDQESRTKTETAVQELMDRAAIHDVIMRFAQAMDRRDWDLMSSCFTSDAIFDVGPSFPSEIKQVIPLICENLVHFGNTMHFMGNQLIELEGDRARAETYALDYHCLKVEGNQEDLILEGYRFLDELVRQGEKWLIQRRMCEYVWQRKESVAVPAGN